LQITTPFELRPRVYLSTLRLVTIEPTDGFL